MDRNRTNFTDEQLSDLMRGQRRKGAEISFGYVFCAGLLAAVLVPLLKDYLAGQEIVFALTLVICGAGFAISAAG